ncbi:MAG TPA: DUF116 domain-containing protein [Thermoflexia bacterium]|nr:DUF116 domain-containing protein [Thermoflexia bacterium]
MKDITRQTFTSSVVENVPFDERVLLLPHCLRPSQGCPGKMTKQGLDCTGCDHTECAIYQLRAAAIEAGYKGVCIAPGGRMAVRFLAEHQPAGVVAVACQQELEEGVEAIDKMEWEHDHPLISVVPLLRDGCVDTEVDVEAARAIIFSRNGVEGL